MGKVNTNQPHLIKLDLINLNNGKIIKFIDKNHKAFEGFGELYFSSVNFKTFKGWKLNENATQIVYAVQGSVCFYCGKDEGKSISSFELEALSNAALVIPPKTWYAFQGCSRRENTVMSMVNIPHINIEKRNSEFCLEDLKGLEE